jgi:hypothetical protein
MVKAAFPTEVLTLTRFEPLLNVPGTADRLADKLRREPQDVIYMALDADQAVELIGKLRRQSVKTILMGGQQLPQAFWRFVPGRQISTSSRLSTAAAARISQCCRSTKASWYHSRFRLLTAM